MRACLGAKCGGVCCNLPFRNAFSYWSDPSGITPSSAYHRETPTGGKRDRSELRDHRKRSKKGGNRNGELEHQEIPSTPRHGSLFTWQNLGRSTLGSAECPRSGQGSFNLKPRSKDGHPHDGQNVEGELLHSRRGVTECSGAWKATADNTAEFPTGRTSLWDNKNRKARDECVAILAPRKVVARMSATETRASDLI